MVDREKNFQLRANCHLVTRNYFISQIYVSRKWGFTKWDREEYEELMAVGRLFPDGVSVQYRPEHGPLLTWKKVQLELAGLA